MKCTIIFGSPRKEGNTIKLLDVVIRELKQANLRTTAAAHAGADGNMATSIQTESGGQTRAGTHTGSSVHTESGGQTGDGVHTESGGQAGADVQIDRFDVYDNAIGGCRACLGCQHNADEICCVIDDDMQPILKSVAECDTLIIAAPVYVWSFPAPVKAVVDRLVYSSCKQYGDNPGGPHLLEGKHLAIITTCGYPVEKGADLLEEEMRRFCKHTKMEYAGMLCERQRNLKEEFMDESKATRARQFAETIKRLYK